MDEAAFWTPEKVAELEPRPINCRAWRVVDIAAWLKITPDTALEKVVTRRGFPERFRGNNLVNGRWRPNQVYDFFLTASLEEDDARTGPTVLYRHFDQAGILLYVGVSASLMVRTVAHVRASAWRDEIATIKVERFPTRGEALAAETQAIRVERPLYNIAGALRK